MICSASPSTQQGVGFCWHNHRAQVCWEAQGIACAHNRGYEAEGGLTRQLNRNIFTDWISCWPVKKHGVFLLAILQVQVYVWPCCSQYTGLRERQVFKDSSTIFLALCIYAHRCVLYVVEWLYLNVCKPLQVWALTKGRGWWYMAVREAGCQGLAAV